MDVKIHMITMIPKNVNARLPKKGSLSGAVYNKPFDDLMVECYGTYKMCRVMTSKSHIDVGYGPFGSIIFEINLSDDLKAAKDASLNGLYIELDHAHSTVESLVDAYDYMKDVDYLKWRLRY